MKHIMKSASREHQALVELTNKTFEGEMVAIKGNETIKGNYYPDVILNGIDIECELIKNNILSKVRKGKNGNKKILIIGYPKYVLDFFDEIWALDTQTNKLIKLKVRTIKE